MSDDSGSIDHEENSSARRPNPLVFISHDTRDAELAEAFSKLLSNVSLGVLKSFRSSDKKGTQGIQYGTEWYPRLMSQLSTASDVVCLLTAQSIDRPWILYEAGVAKGRLDVPVLGVALGIPLSRASSGPFAQFQNSGDDEDSLTKLVLQLAARVPEAEPDRDAVLMQVKAFKERVGSVLASGPPEAPESVPDASSIAKIFEEIKVMFEDLPARVQRIADQDLGGRRVRRIRPEMLFDLAMTSARHRNDFSWLLLLLAPLRDDAPAAYEIGIESYRAIRLNPMEAPERLQLLAMTLSDFVESPWGREIVGSRESYMFLRELPSMISRLAEGLGLESDPPRLRGARRLPAAE